MSNILKVNDGVLGTLSGDFRNEVSRMDATLSEYQSGMGTLRCSWTGSASDSASASHQTWETDMNQQIDYLEELAKIIDKIDTMYVECDEKVASLWKI
jgi:WXG100 family type VII secretion target